MADQIETIWLEIQKLSIQRLKLTTEHTVIKIGIVSYDESVTRCLFQLDNRRQKFKMRRIYFQSLQATKKDFFRSSGPGYPHPVCSELVISGTRETIVAVGDCSVTERRRWLPSYQTGKTAHVQAKKKLQTQRGRTHDAGCTRSWFRTAEPLGERHYEIWITATTTATKSNT